MEKKSDFIHSLKSLPVAINTSEANEQHYEVSRRRRDRRPSISLLLQSALKILHILHALALRPPHSTLSLALREPITLNPHILPMSNTHVASYRVLPPVPREASQVQQLPVQLSQRHTRPGRS